MQTPPIISRYSSALEKGLRGALEGRNLPLYDMMRYHLGWIDEKGSSVNLDGGKRRAAMLCFMACEAVGGRLDQVVLPAVALELLQEFSTIHRDIQAGNPDRGGRPAVWWVWGASQGINAGDGMYSVATLALLGLHEKGVPAGDILEVGRLLDMASIRVCESQQMELSWQDSTDVGVDDYLGMIGAGVAAITSVGCQIGALLSAGDIAESQSFSKIGEKLGLAYQIQDDVQDLWGWRDGSKAPSIGIAHLRKTFPGVYGIEHGVGADREELVRLYSKRVLTDGEIERAVALLEQMHAKDFALERAREYKQEALKILESQANICLINDAGSFLGECDQLVDYLETIDGDLGVIP